MKLSTLADAYSQKNWLRVPLTSTYRLRAVGTPWHTMATPKKTAACRRSSANEASRLSPIALGRSCLVAIRPPGGLKCLREAKDASPDGPAVRATPRDRDP